MKKLVIMLILISILLCLGGCWFEEEEQPKEEKVYKVGDRQGVDGIFITVTNVESAPYCDNRKSANGSWVKVHFTAENTKNEPQKIFYTSFTLNDTYTIRETTYRLTNIESGGFALVKGNVYEFYAVFDCTYSHYYADMVFEWEKGWFDGKRKWII